MIVTIHQIVDELKVTRLDYCAFCRSTAYNKNSSGDEIANVNFCTTTTYM